MEGALAGTLGPGGESRWGCIRVLIPEPANFCGAGERWQPWLDVSHSGLVGEWARVLPLGRSGRFVKNFQESSWGLELPL